MDLHTSLFDVLRFVLTIALAAYGYFQRREQEKKLVEVLGRINELDRKTKHLDK